METSFGEAHVLAFKRWFRAASQPWGHSAMEVHEPRKNTHSVQWVKHLGTECRLDFKILEGNANPLTQFVSLQKCWIWIACLGCMKVQPRSRTSKSTFLEFVRAAMSLDRSLAQCLFSVGTVSVFRGAILDFEHSKRACPLQTTM